MSEYLRWGTNEVITKMAEQTQLQQVMMKDQKIVAVGKRLAECIGREKNWPKLRRRKVNIMALGPLWLFGH